MKGIKILVGLVLLQAAVIVGMWLSPAVQPAAAQIPDPAAQREQMVQQLTATNAKLDKIIDLLSGGNVQVKLAKPDDKDGQ